MIENSNFRGGFERADDDGNAVTLMKANGLMRAAGKQFASNGCRRRTVIKPEGYNYILLSGLFANSGGTAEICVFVLFY